MKMRIGISLMAITLAIASGSQTGDLEVTVLDSFGNVIASEVSARLYGEDGYSSRVKGSRSLVWRRVPVGAYTLEVVCSGFRLFSRRVRISGPAQVVTVGLKVASIGDPVSKGLTISGRVEPCPASGAFWVKLFGIFIDDVFQAKVPNNCSFRIEDVSGGSYVGILIEGDTVIDTRTFIVTTESQPVTFTARGVMR